MSEKAANAAFFMPENREPISEALNKTTTY
jgi:hypothetical protein